MSKILKSPMIVLLITSFFCVAGAYLDYSIDGEYILFVISIAVGIFIGMLVLWKTSQMSFVLIFNRWFNPFFKKQRRYIATLTVACTESLAFDFCASMLHAASLRYESHSNLGTIIAYQSARSFPMLPKSYRSFGVDVIVKVEPIDSDFSLVAISAESRRSIMNLGIASWGERWDYETKGITEELLGILLTILDRKSVKYEDYKVL